MVRSKRRLIHGIGHGPPGERFYCTDKRICPCVNYRCPSLHVCVLISMPVVVCLSFCTLSNIQRHRNVQKGSKMEIQITPDVNCKQYHLMTSIRSSSASKSLMNILQLSKYCDLYICRAPAKAALSPLLCISAILTI